MSLKIQPANVHLIEVKLRAEFADAEGAAAFALLREQGLTALK